MALIFLAFPSRIPASERSRTKVGSGVRCDGDATRSERELTSLSPEVPFEVLPYGSIDSSRGLEEGLDCIERVELVDRDDGSGLFGKKGRSCEVLEDSLEVGRGEDVVELDVVASVCRKRKRRKEQEQ